MSSPAMTFEEFFRLEPHGRGRHELIAGDVVISEPDFRHQAVVRRLVTALTLWCDAAPGRGTPTLNVDTAVGEDLLVPDLQWYAADRVLNDPTDRPQPLGDLIVEVRSPSTWHRDVGVKRTAYEEHGARELWLIDPLSETAMVFRRAAAGSTRFDVASDVPEDGELTSPLLPGFAIALARLFG